MQQSPIYTLLASVKGIRGSHLRAAHPNASEIWVALTGTLYADLQGQHCLSDRGGTTIGKIRTASCQKRKHRRGAMILTLGRRLPDARLGIDLCLFDT